MGKEENIRTWVQRSINDHFLPTLAYLWQRQLQTTVNKMLRRLSREFYTPGAKNVVSDREVDIYSLKLV